MTRATIAILAGSLLAGAAISQPPPYPPGPAPYDSGAFWRGAPESPRDRLHFLEDRIRTGVERGSISRDEATRINGQIYATRDWAQRMQYRNGGRLSPPQEAELQQRLDRISGEVHWLKSNPY